jgi:hypothetical protein
MKTEFTPLLFWIFGGLFLLYALVSGWRRGIVRQSLNVLAVLAAYFVGVFGGRLLLPFLRTLGYPDLAISFVGGSILGLIVYLAISALGTILFKKTSQQDVMLVRWGYGLGGALIGTAFGVFLLWFSLIALRLLGTIAETELKVAQAPPVRPEVAARLGKAGRHAPKAPEYHDPGIFVRGIASAKHSMEEGPAGAFIDKVDPLPGRIYSMMAKTTRVLASQTGIEHFIEFPGVKKLSENSRIRSLLNDPEIARAARDRHYIELMKNPQLVNALNDPEVMEMVKRIELEKALDYALREDQAEVRSQRSDVRKD